MIFFLLFQSILFLSMLFAAVIWAMDYGGSPGVVVAAIILFPFVHFILKPYAVRWRISSDSDERENVDELIHFLKACEAFATTRLRSYYICSISCDYRSGHLSATLDCPEVPRRYYEYFSGYARADALNEFSSLYSQYSAGTLVETLDLGEIRRNFGRGAFLSTNAIDPGDICICLSYTAPVKIEGFGTKLYGADYITYLKRRLRRSIRGIRIKVPSRNPNHISIKFKG